MYIHLFYGDVVALFHAKFSQQAMCHWISATPKAQAIRWVNQISLKTQTFLLDSQGGGYWVGPPSYDH